MRTTPVESSSGPLTQYDPQKGLQRIARDEVAIKHYARAKDAAKLAIAIRDKLERQAEFVTWWDTQANKRDGRPSKTVADQPRLLAGRDGLPDRDTIRRWRAKLGDETAFESSYEKALARYPKILEFQTTAHVGYNSGENEWYTPKDYIEAARAVLGAIDLDPATSETANRVVQAAQIFTLADNGLAQQWHGRVWLNPPYAQPHIELFCAKLADSVKTGTVIAAVVLVNNATETAWFRSLADVAVAICFPTGRVRFWNETEESATPLQGQAVLYFGSAIESFCEYFQPFGFLTAVLR